MLPQKLGLAKLPRGPCSAEATAVWARPAKGKVFVGPIANAATAKARNKIARRCNKGHLRRIGNYADTETEMRNFETLTSGLFAVATIVLAVEAIIAF